MKWLSVLALCVALFIAATHASQLQDEAGKDEVLIQFLLTKKAMAELEQARDKETSINKDTVAKNLRLEDAQKSGRADSQWWWVRRNGCYCAIPPCRCAGK